MIGNCPAQNVINVSCLFTKVRQHKQHMLIVFFLFFPISLHLFSEDFLRKDGEIITPQVSIFFFSHFLKFYYKFPARETKKKNKINQKFFPSRSSTPSAWSSSFWGKTPRLHSNKRKIHQKIPVAFFNLII